MPQSSDPIAVFDSGVGGLTVLHELLVSLPQEDFLYLGDTARFPYGERSAAELERFESVDLVTHDWGAILALRVLADQPANVRSWATDMGDLGPDFRWHDTAITFQTPGDGEALVAGLVESGLDDKAAIPIRRLARQQHMDRRGGGRGQRGGVVQLPVGDDDGARDACLGLGGQRAGDRLAQSRAVRIVADRQPRN